MGALTSADVPAPVMPWRRRAILPMLLPWLAAILLAGFYAAAAMPNQFVYDDHEVIENQFPLRTAADLRAIFSEPHYFNFPYYRPITRTTFAIQRAIWGNQPGPYHLFNALLAGATLLAAYVLLRAPGLQLTPAAALAAAIVFMVHPAASDCVYPAASGRETMLPVFIVLLSMACWMRQGAIWRCIAIGLFVVALFAKEVAVVLPVLFVAADLLHVSPPPPDRRAAVGRYLPLPLILAGYFAVRHAVFGRGMLHLDVQNHPAGPVLSMLFGVQTSILPFTELTYEPTRDVWWSAAKVVASLIVMAFIVVAGWRAGGAVRRITIFWMTWFVIVQLPTAQILRQEAPYSERYVFPAVLAVGAVLAVVAGRARRGRGRFIARSGTVVVIAVLAAVSFIRAGFYFDDHAFAAQWVRTNPDSANAHNGLAYYAAAHGDVAGAIAEYQRSLQLNPDSVTALNNLANLQSDRGDYAGAAGNYRKLLALNPDDYTALCNLGDAEAGRNRMAEAIGDYRAALHLRPQYAHAHHALAIALARSRQPEAAGREFAEAVRLNPTAADALIDYATFLALAPPPLGNLDRATELAGQAIRAGGDNPRVLDAASSVYAAAGRFTDAAELARRALAGAKVSGNAAQAASLQRRLSEYESERNK